MVHIDNEQLKIDRELALTQLAALGYNLEREVFTLALVGGAA